MLTSQTTKWKLVGHKFKYLTKIDGWDYGFVYKLLQNGYDNKVDFHLNNFDIEQNKFEIHLIKVDTEQNKLEIHLLNIEIEQNKFEIYLIKVDTEQNKVELNLFKFDLFNLLCKNNQSILVNTEDCLYLCAIIIVYTCW